VTLKPFPFSLSYPKLRLSIEAKAVSQSIAFRRFGLTDVITFYLAQEYLVITDDFPLAGYIGKHHFDVINIHHILDY
jgi:hypothetical protein